MQPKHILIIGNYGAGNLGDDAILGGILTDLKQVGQQGAISVMVGKNHHLEMAKECKKVPFVPSGIKSFLFGGTLKSAKAAIRSADLVILGGGGLFTDAESWRAPWIWFNQARMCWKLKTPYICYGQSVGPLNSWFSRCLTKWVFKGAKAVHVRDAASAKRLFEMGISNVTIGSDPAFSWLAEQNSAEQEQPVLLLPFRLWPGVTKETWNELLKPIQDFANEKQLKPILVTMDASNHKEIDQMKTLGLELLQLTSAKALYSAFKRASMVVSMRLHGVIFAVSAGKPTLALTYSDKVKDLVNSFPEKKGLHCLPLEADLVKETLEELWNEGGTKVNVEALIESNQAFLRSAFLD